MNYSSPTTYFLSAIAIVMSINISATGVAFAISELTDYTSSAFFEDCINTTILCVSMLIMVVSVVALGHFIKNIKKLSE